MNYYEHHLGDYAEATAHLSLIEDAVYSRLIRKYYATELPIPADLKVVQRLVGARSPAERQAVTAVLEEFFVLEDDGWHNARCDQELARYHDKQAKAKRSANARWAPSERNADASSNAMRSHSEGNALQSPVSSNQTPIKKLHTQRVREETGETERQISECMLAIKAIYPKAAREDWITGEKNARNRVLNDGATWNQLLEGVERYAKHCRVTGRMPLNPARFFGDVDRPWAQEWPLPETAAQAPRKTKYELMMEKIDAS